MMPRDQISRAELREIESLPMHAEPCPRCGDEDCILGDCTSKLNRRCRCGKPRLAGRIKCAGCENERAAESREGASA